VDGTWNVPTTLTFVGCIPVPQAKVLCPFALVTCGYGYFATKTYMNHGWKKLYLLSAHWVRLACASAVMVRRTMLHFELCYTLRCLEMVMSATPAMMIAEARKSLGLTDSFKMSHPRKTATIGLTYAYVEITEGEAWFINHTKVV